jgi:hypothetical protein
MRSLGDTFNRARAIQEKNFAVLFLRLVFSRRVSMSGYYSGYSGGEISGYH